MLAGYPLSYWIIFNLLVLSLLWLDLSVFHRKNETVSFKSALGWTAFWITLAMLFNGWVVYEWGWDKGLEFFTGYVIEKSLSVDNLFVFLMVFSYFRVPRIFQHRILFWGVIGALILRFIFIIIGAHLVQNFSWVLYIFGAFLLYTAWHMWQSSPELELEDNWLLQGVKRILPIKRQISGPEFWVIEDGKFWFTPLFLTLITIEFTDVIFAIDSIPAIFAVTTDPFMVFTSNVFAILGLRSLFFVLEGLQNKFAYLRYGLACVLGFVGLKMLLSAWVHVPIWLSLTVIATALMVSMAISLRKSK